MTVEEIKNRLAELPPGVWSARSMEITSVITLDSEEIAEVYNVSGNPFGDIRIACFFADSVEMVKYLLAKLEESKRPKYEEFVVFPDKRKWGGVNSG